MINKFLNMNLTERLPQDFKKMRLMEIEDRKDLVLFLIRMVSLHGKLLVQSRMLI